MQVTITNWVTVAQCAGIVLGAIFVKSFVSAAVSAFRNHKEK